MPLLSRERGEGDVVSARPRTHDVMWAREPGRGIVPAAGRPGSPVRQSGPAISWFAPWQQPLLTRRAERGADLPQAGNDRS